MIASVPTSVKIENELVSLLYMIDLEWSRPETLRLQAERMESQLIHLDHFHMDTDGSLFDESQLCHGSSVQADEPLLKIGVLNDRQKESIDETR